MRRKASGDRAARRRHDEAGDALLHQRLQHLVLAHRILGGVGDERHDAGRLEDALDADRQLRIEGVGQVVDDHADDVGLRLAQIGGAAIVDVADIVDGLAHLARRSPAGSGRCPAARATRSTSTRRPRGRCPGSSPCAAGHSRCSSQLLLERSNSLRDRASIAEIWRFSSAEMSELLDTRTMAYSIQKVLRSSCQHAFGTIVFS